VFDEPDEGLGWPPSHQTLDHPRQLAYRITPLIGSIGSQERPSNANSQKEMPMQVQQFPIDRTYTDKHSWLALAPGTRFSDDPLRTGVTPTAVTDLDIVSLELPPVRSTVQANTPCGVIRTASGSAIPIYAPIGGLVTIHNAEALGNPRLVAEDPFHAGWLLAILPAADSSANELLTQTQYCEEVRAAA
jgi:glycine cleavage system H protein